jgi:hypothetical protein
MGIPSLVVFVVGMPLSLVVYLAKRKDRFYDDKKFQAKVGFIYIATNPNKWWWFFVAMIRTSVLVIIGLLTSDPGYQNLIAQLWLIFYLLFLFYSKPYEAELRSLRNMEVVSVVCILALLYVNMWGLLMPPFEYEMNQGTFTFVIILLVVFSFVILTILALYVFVADKTRKTPQELSFGEIVQFFKRKGIEGVKSAKKISKNFASQGASKEQRSRPAAARDANGAGSFFLREEHREDGESGKAGEEQQQDEGNGGNGTDHGDASKSVAVI